MPGSPLPEWMRKSQKRDYIDPITKAVYDWKTNEKIGTFVGGDDCVHYDDGTTTVSRVNDEISRRRETEKQQRIQENTPAPYNEGVGLLNAIYRAVFGKFPDDE